MSDLEDLKQEVAERLRNVQVYDSFEDGACLCDQFDVINALGLVPDEDTSWITADSVDALAGLIDPTCKRVAMDAAGNPPYYTGGFALNDVMGGCSECGYPFGGSYHNLGNLANAPNYCPNCGARVVSEDE